MMRKYARIYAGRVVEFASLDATQDINYIIPFMLWVDVTDVIPPVQFNWAATETVSGWSFAEYVPPPPTAAEILAAQRLKLQIATQLAADQKVALVDRIGVLNDAIEKGMVTPVEQTELAARTLQLEAWKTCAILLGRVTAQTGWPASVTWPTQPADGMDLTVSAVAKAVQAS